jgi:hypothetical protein
MTVTNGLEVHETTLILGAETPSHLLTNESWANAQLGWKIVPEWVKTEVVTARMMDPGDDLDWKVEKAEARARGLSLAARRRCLAAVASSRFAGKIPSDSATTPPTDAEIRGAPALRQSVREHRIDCDVGSETGCAEGECQA